MPERAVTEEDLLTRILNARGFTDSDNRDAYLGAALAKFDPGDRLPGVLEATDRILQGLGRGERIAVYGDYDVDGVTSTAILTRVMRGIAPNAEIEPYIPHRIDEGYGLNIAALKELAVREVTLVITVDCGITATREAAACRDLGIDLIITDHHVPGDSTLPEAAAIVHPALPGSDYAWPQLSGSAVAYILARSLACAHQGVDDPTGPLAETLKDVLCLAGMGVIADVVPLVGENRKFAAKAIKLMRSCSLAGIKAMLEVCVKPGESIASETVGFRIGPRLNAAGRMGHAQAALDVLLTDDDAEAAVLAARLSKINQSRQTLAAELTEQANTLAVESGMTGDDQRMIVLSHRDWHPGVIGIVCSRLVGRHHRPVVLMCEGESDVLKGSARSIDGYSIHDALRSVGDQFESFGGHAMAAGMSLKRERFEEVQQALISHANERLKPEDLVTRIEIDCEVDLAELTIDAVTQLQKMQPTGRANESACLIARNVAITKTRVMAKSSVHLELTFGPFRCPWFQHGHFESTLPRGAIVDIVFEPAINTWGGRSTVQLLIKDVRRR
jgi:single-stranded-DNA-specific exonuclease